MDLYSVKKTPKCLTSLLSSILGRSKFGHAKVHCAVWAENYPTVNQYCILK